MVVGVIMVVLVMFVVVIVFVAAMVRGDKGGANTWLL